MGRLSFLLDSNVLSEPSRRLPNAHLLARLMEHYSECCTAAPVFHELRYGLSRMPMGYRRRELTKYVEQALSPLVIFPYERKAALWHAEERARLVTLPFCHITLHSPKLKDSAYPKDITTLGDHIRATRLDRNLLQRDVAKAIGICMSTLLDWEKLHHEPKIWHYPKIMEFLGYCPYQSVNTLGDFILTYRIYRLGWSQEEMARAIGIDPTTLARIEGNHGNRVYKSSVDQMLLD